MLAVRWLHLVGMAVAVGGATLTWGLFRRAGERTDATIEFAATYEWLFWAAMGALVMTGVGNLGSLAPYVPAAETDWGVVFAVKLLAVMAVLVLSVVRTLLVGRYRRVENLPASSARILRVSYAATALALAGIVALAGVLAHG